MRKDKDCIIQEFKINDITYSVTTNKDVCVYTGSYETHKIDSKYWYKLQVKEEKTPPIK